MLPQLQVVIKVLLEFLPFLQNAGQIFLQVFLQLLRLEVERDCEEAWNIDGAVLVENIEAQRGLKRLHFLANLSDQSGLVVGGTT